MKWEEKWMVKYSLFAYCTIWNLPFRYAHTTHVRNILFSKIWNLRCNFFTFCLMIILFSFAFLHYLITLWWVWEAIVRYDGLFSFFFGYEKIIACEKIAHNIKAFFKNNIKSYRLFSTLPYGVRSIALYYVRPCGNE